MARVPTQRKQSGEDMQGLLNNLHDWELSFKDKHKNIKSKLREDETGTQGVGKSRNPAAPYINYNPITHHLSEESSIDANSEKELGNELFKQKKFNEAIDCYSRSIALSPTAVAYANRAMAYLKIKRFQKAENDCTEALNLDDRYIKAYSRRSTARKQVGKLKESIEDVEFALRLEPQNQEIKKQHTEVKALYEKEILKRVSGATGVFAQGAQNSGNTIKSGPVIQPVSSSSQKVAEVPRIPTKENNRDVPGTAMEVEDTHIQINSKDLDASRTLLKAYGRVTTKKTHKTSKQELKESVQDLAARAAALAKAEAAKSIAAPNSAYQFEVSWRGLSGDRTLQTQLLKVTSPATLPRIFKNALSAPMLMDIVRCVATFFIEDMNLAIRYLENLTKVPRFDMIIMCLSSSDKSELFKIWEEIFCKGAAEHTATLGALCFKYGLKQ
ncbi:uncharacterized protein LOC132042513 [Lycium ferocissimum]|uniref:uncharacterized protein LOC132042513 n=1 Tax=Lycium ferocissimum TaxID=112874 RepID=UPI002814B2E5|nr:uncharacterized protein LOC132042513 [Lycium ferocissimum]